VPPCLIDVISGHPYNVRWAAPTSGVGPEPTRANEGAKSGSGGKAALGRQNVEA
jgi:hypothetical protein